MSRVSQDRNAGRHAEAGRRGRADSGADCREPPMRTRGLGMTWTELRLRIRNCGTVAQDVWASAGGRGMGTGTVGPRPAFTLTYKWYV